MATGYYGLDNPNPRAGWRGDGYYWGYSSMNNDPTAIVVHTTESLADLDGPDEGAENVARWFTTNDVPASYHWLCDSDSEIDFLPCGLDHFAVHTAFHTAGYNSRMIGLSMAMRADSWPRLPEGWKRAVLTRMARRAAALCVRWGIPARKITKAEADAGVKGITGHGILDPGYRYDPGDLFPWDQFIMMVLTEISEALVGIPEGGEQYMLQHFVRVTEGTYKGTVYARYTTGALVPIAPEEFNTEGGKIKVVDTTSDGLLMALSNR